MINYCTLFDSNFLSRGIALYDSLKTHAHNFHLYVVAFDDKCYNYLLQRGFSEMTVISLMDFEDEELISVKGLRSPGEYCWTCTPSVILYCIKKYKLDSCTYLDADMVFYHDPRLLIDEMGDKDVLITEHRYTKDYDVSDTHGIYCVQFIYFKNTVRGMAVLDWWRDRCIEWCYARLEDGKFGDQKYLDDWLTRFEGVHVLQHPGGGVAPWNVQQYNFENNNGNIMLKRIGSPSQYPVVFFHFHGLKFYTDNFISLCGALYELNKKVKDVFYEPYIKTLLKIESGVQGYPIPINVTGAKNKAPGKRRVVFEFLKDFGSMVIRGKASAFKLRNYNFKLHYHIYDLDKFK